LIACGARTSLDAPIDASGTNLAPCEPKRYDAAIVAAGWSAGFALGGDSIFATTADALVRIDQETGASNVVANGAFEDVMVDEAFVYVMHDGSVSKIPKSGGAITDLATTSGSFVGQTSDKVFVALGNDVVVVPKSGGPTASLMSPSSVPITAIIAAAADDTRIFWSSGVAIYTASLDATNTSPTCYGDYPTDFGYALAIDDAYIWTVATHTMMRMSKGGGDVTYFDTGIGAPLAAAHGVVFGKSKDGIARFANGTTTTVSSDFPQRLVVQDECIYAAVLTDGGLALERFPIE
jgi:hypothetical protein